MAIARTSRRLFWKACRRKVDGASAVDFFLSKPYSVRMMNSSATKIDQLDGLRFIAFLMVFFFHFQVGPDYPLIRSIQQRGWVGVEVFFALSSFLLFGLLQTEFARTGRINFSMFYARRLLRIYPLMVLFPVAMLAARGPQNEAAYGWLLGLASFVGNFIYWTPENGKAIANTGHLWSLSYEFQIYLVLPLLFLACRMVGTRAFGKALLLLLPLCLAGRAAFWLSGTSSHAIYMTPLLRPEATIAGILLALGIARGIPLPAMVGTLLASAAAILLLPGVNSPAGSVGIYIATGIFAGSLLHVTLTSKSIAAAFRFTPIAYLGKISFGLYVFHLEAMELGIGLLRSSPVQESYATRVLFALAVCIAMAAASYHFLEKPLLRLKPRPAANKLGALSQPA